MSRAEFRADAPRDAPVFRPRAPTRSPHAAAYSGRMPPEPARRRRPVAPPPAGFTLVEALTAIAVLAVLLTLALPSLRALVDRHRVTHTAADVAGHLHYARMAAIERQEPVRVSTLADGAGGHCLAVHTGPATSCSCAAGRPTAGACAADAVLLRHVHLPAHGRVRLAASVGSLRFDPQLGTCTPAGTLAFSTPAGDAVHQVVNVMGRVRACSPSGKVGGHVAC